MPTKRPPTTSRCVTCGPNADTGRDREVQGLRVLALESRRGTEFAALIRTYGGQPIEAPALREVFGDFATHGL